MRGLTTDDRGDLEARGLWKNRPASTVGRIYRFTTAADDKTRQLLLPHAVISHDANGNKRVCHVRRERFSRALHESARNRDFETSPAAKWRSPGSSRLNIYDRNSLLALRASRARSTAAAAAFFANCRRNLFELRTSEISPSFRRAPTVV